MSDWSGWAAMTGVDKKLWESEWVAFIVATSPRGNALRRVATLSLALWSQQSLSTIAISSLVPLFLTHAEFEPMKESNETRLEPADNVEFCLEAVWGLTVEITAFCLLHAFCILYFLHDLSELGEKKEKELKGSPAKASCAIYICVIVMCQQHPSLPYAVNTCPCSGVSSTTVASRRLQFKGVPCCFLLQPPQCSFAVPLLVFFFVCFFAWDSGRLEQTKWKAPVIFFKTFHLLRFSLRSSVTCLFS